MQSLYSLSLISPSLCKMFVSFRSRKLTFFRKKKKRRPDGAGACVLEGWDTGSISHLGGDDGAANSPPVSCLQLPRLSQGSPPRSSMSFIAGRHSDATIAFPRFSTSSSSCYERLSVEYSQEEGQDLPRRLKLGALTHQDSPMRASCTSSRRRRSVYAQPEREILRKQPHIGEIFAGHQFLTPLTSTQTVMGSPRAQPFSGLIDAGLRCRDADLKDRIILFL